MRETEEPATKGHRSSVLRIATVLFWILLILHLVPIWIFPLLPTQDGPAHIYNSDVLARFGRAEWPELREYFRINRNLDPNWASHVLMAAASMVVGPVIAEKLLVSLYLLFLPLTVRYLIWSPTVATATTEAPISDHRRGLADESRAVASLLVFPFLYSYSLHMGFYNFVMSLGFFFAVLGFYVRYRDAMTPGRILVLALLILALYFCHAVSLVASILGIGAIAFWQSGVVEMIYLPETQGPHRLWESLKRFGYRFYQLLVPAAVAFLPATILLIEYLIRSTAAVPLATAVPPTSHDWIERALRLFSLSSLVSYSWAEFCFTSALVVVFAASSLVLLRRKWYRGRVESADAFLMMACGFVILYFVAPDELAGGSVLLPRLELYPYLCCILWFAASSLGRPLSQWLIVSATAISVGLLGGHVRSYTRFAAALDEVRSVAEAVEPHSTLLAVALPGKAGYRMAPTLLRVNPLKHASCYVALDSRAVLLANYEAAHAYFPIQFRSGYNPYEIIGPFHADPFSADLERFHAGGATSVDYVLLCGMDDDDLKPGSPLETQMTAHYEPIRTSAPHRLVRLYRRRVDTLETPVGEGADEARELSVHRSTR